MKKFLSLVLALVMTMSLVTVSAGAKEFKDETDVTYDEAVAVISEIGVVDGDTSGNFRPTDNLSRGAAAKIICNLILGPTTAAELKADTAPYKDVPVSNVFSGYIAYCAKEGIISGYADGSFRPAGTLTGYAFMKMLLGALGYDSKNEGYTGANWSIAVAKQAIGIGLNAGLTEEFNGVDFVTREEAALYAFNTLKATMVDYEQKITTTINGVEVVISQGNEKPVTWSESRSNDGNIKDDGFVQFAEEFFPKLEKTTDRDAFGRPSRTWDYKGDAIGTYVNHDLLVESYTTKVTGKDLYTLLGKNAIEDYDVSVYVDGETEKDVLGGAYFTDKNMIKTNTEGVGATGNGVLTEVYLDSDAKEITVAIINTYLAIADDDYNEKKDQVSYEVWGLDEAVKGAFVKNTDEKSTLTVSGEDFAIEDVVDGDIVRVTVADGEIQTIDAVEVLEETTITRFSKNKSVTAEGEEYKYASAAMYDDEVLDQYDADNMKEQTYNVYLDQYGYLLGIEIVDKVSQYLFVTGMNGGNDNLANKKGSANVILLDGTMATVDVNLAKSNVNESALANTWCKYSVDKNDVYTLTVVKSTGFDSEKDKAGQSKMQTNDTATVGYTKTLDKKNTTLSGEGDLSVVYGNESSVYMTVSTTEINTTRPGGLAIVVDDVYTLFNDDGYVIAAIVVGEDDGTSSNFAYVTSKTGKNGLNMEEFDSTTEDYTWTRNVIINGEEVEIKEVTDTNPEIATMEQNEWYEVKYFADGTVRGVTKLNFASSANDKYEENIENIEDALNGRGNYGSFDTVLLFDDMTNAPYSLSCKGNTFFATSSVKSGFAVAPDAKIVLVQDKKVDSSKDVTLMADVQAFDNGVDGIEKAFKRMNDNSNFKGYISAVFEDGIATSVVIYDKTATVVEDGGIDQNANYVTKATVDEDTLTVTVKALPTAKDKTAAVISALKAAGYTDIEVKAGEARAYKDGAWYTFTVNVKNAYKVTLTDNGAATFGPALYMVAGDKVTVTLHGTSAYIFSTSNTMTPDKGFSIGNATANSAWTVTAGVISADTHSVTFDLTAPGSLAADTTVTITIL